MFQVNNRRGRRRGRGERRGGEEEASLRPLLLRPSSTSRWPIVLRIASASEAGRKGLEMDRGKLFVGFITYDSEDTVDKLLLDTFHDLNDKKVEVKRAVPKELSPGTKTWLETDGYNYSVNRGNSFLSGYTQGYKPSSISGYGMKMDAKLGALSSCRNGHTSLGPGFRVGIDHDPTLRSSILGNANHNSILKYGQELSFYYSRNSSRSNSPIPYSDINQNTSTLVNLMPQNVLGNTGFNYTVNCTAATASMASGSENPGSFRNSSLNWGGISFPISSQFGGTRSGFLDGRSFEKSVSPPVANTNVTTSSSGYEASYEDLFGDNSFYGDPTWRSSFSDLDVTGSLSYRFSNSDSDITGKEIENYARGYYANNRQTYAD